MEPTKKRLGLTTLSLSSPLWSLGPWGLFNVILISFYVYSMCILRLLLSFTILTVRIATISQMLRFHLSFWYRTNPEETWMQTNLWVTPTIFNMPLHEYRNFVHCSLWFQHEKIRKPPIIDCKSSVSKLLAPLVLDLESDYLLVHE